MKPNRMSIEELLELKPSMENPIELTCDDGYYDGDLYKIKIIAAYGNDVCFIHKGSLVVWVDNFLYHYPSFKQPKKRNLEVFYEAIDQAGNVSFCCYDKTDYIIAGGVVNPDGHENLFVDFVLIPNGRKLIYDHDNKELLAWDEELLK